MAIKFSGVEKNVDETWVLILKQSPHESDNRKPLNNGLLRWETRVKCSGSALVSCDMMYREGLVSSYLVPISLSLVSECNMRTPSPRVAPCLPYLRLMSGIISAHVSRVTCRDSRASVWINPQDSDICWMRGKMKRNYQVSQNRPGPCFDTNTYYVKLRVCRSRKVIILSNVNIYGRQRISNSSWWAVNFDPRLEEILQASVPRLRERESPILPHSFYVRKASSTRWWIMSWMTGCHDDHAEIILCQCGINNRVTRCHLSYGVTQS